MFSKETPAILGGCKEGTQLRILILTGKFCMGHWSASQSLAQQIVDAYPGSEVRVEDFLDCAMPEFSDFLYKSYNRLVTYNPGLFNVYYRMTENSAARPPFEWVFMEKLEELLQEMGPDAIVATHPFCAQVVSRYKAARGAGIPLVTCVTDISAHSEWINPNTDCYLVGSREVRDRLAGKGVDPERIFVTGIPVRAEFRSPRRSPRSGRAGRPRRLLMMGGGLGLVPRKNSFYEALNALPEVETTLICGHNQKLYDRLVGQYPHIEVLGYTDQVCAYMNRADLMLSKPGGITLFESIFSELPMLAWEPFWEQERKNARFIVKRGIGRVAPKEPISCLEAIKALIYDDRALDGMAARMREMKGSLNQTSSPQIVASVVQASEVRA